MVKFDVGNLLKLPQLLKVPELLMGFIIMIIARNGWNGNPVNTRSLTDLNVDDAAYLNVIVSFAYFFIVAAQLVAILLGDKTPVLDTIFSLCGFFFFLGCGSAIIAHASTFPEMVDGLAPMRGLGSMQIINSLLYLVDFAFSVMNLLKKD